MILVNFVLLKPLLSLTIEIVDQRIAVVLLNHVKNSWVQFILDRQIHAIFDVRNNNERTHSRSQAVMRIHAPLVLNKILGLIQLPDIVKISTDTTHYRICPDRLRGTFR